MKIWHKENVTMHSWKYKKLKDEQRKARRKRKGNGSRHYHYPASIRNKKLIKKIKAKKERNKFLEKIRNTFRRKVFRRKI